MAAISQTTFQITIRKQKMLYFDSSFNYTYSEGSVKNNQALVKMMDW